MTPPDISSAPSRARDHDRRWLILVVLGIAQLMVILDATVINIALPSAQKALGFSNTDRQWVVTAYTLAFGSLLLLGGRLSDLFGLRLTFITGLIGFAVASTVGGAAQSFEMLVAARAVQGAFAALLAPAALSLLTTTFSGGSERSKAFGIYGAIAGAGGGIGLLLGGVLTTYLSWRYTLFINVAFAGAATLGALILIRDATTKAKPHLDVPGTLAASAGLFVLVYGFSQASTKGWGSAITIAFLAAALILLTLFGAIERRVGDPLLPLRVLEDRTRGGSYLAMLFANAGLFGVFLFLTYYMQETLGYSAVKTGFAFLPMVAVVIASSAGSGTLLLRRVGPKPLIAAGMLLAAIGILMLTALGVSSSYAAHILPSLLITGLGLGLVFSTAINTATADVSVSDAGVASATVNTAQQIGGSLGTALLNTVAANATTSYLAGRATTSTVIAHATVHGYTTAFTWAAVVFAVGCVSCGLLLPGRGRQRGLRSDPHYQATLGTTGQLGADELVTAVPPDPQRIHDPGTLKIGLSRGGQ
jgi:EmrB/QacA subfamily drug resistance transporter